MNKNVTISQNLGGATQRNDKSTSSTPARRKNSESYQAQGSFVDPSEIGIDSHGHSYDHGVDDHGWYDSGCGNPSDAG